MTNALFISATDTDVGKTFFASKIITKLLDSGKYQAHDLAYYKPIQSGPDKDYKRIIQDHPQIQTYVSYDLAYPASPDYAAGLEGITIKLDKIKEDFEALRVKHKFIIVEGAGGLAVPINANETVADIAVLLNLPLVLVIRSGLGTINHSILSAEYAKHKGLNLIGIIVSEKDARIETRGRDTAAIASILKHASLKLIDLENLAWI